MNDLGLSIIRLEISGMSLDVFKAFFSHGDSQDTDERDQGGVRRQGGIKEIGVGP